MKPSTIEIIIEELRLQLNVLHTYEEVMGQQFSYVSGYTSLRVALGNLVSALTEKTDEDIYKVLKFAQALKAANDQNHMLVYMADNMEMTIHGHQMSEEYDGGLDDMEEHLLDRENEVMRMETTAAEQWEKPIEATSECGGASGNYIPVSEMTGLHQFLKEDFVGSRYTQLDNGIYDCPVARLFLRLTGVRPPVGAHGIYSRHPDLPHEYRFVKVWLNGEVISDRGFYGEHFNLIQDSIRSDSFYSAAIELQ